MREPPQYLSSNEGNHTLYRGNSSLLLETPIGLKPSRLKSKLGTALGGWLYNPRGPTDSRFDHKGSRHQQHFINLCYEAMLDRRVRFIESEVARIKPEARRAVLAHGEVDGELPYDYLIFALGRRLATERITGFFEHSHHLLTVEGALKFGEALREFHEGRAIIGQCPGARLPVPVYETAFALARLSEERGERDRVRITIVSPDSDDLQFGDGDVTSALRTSLDKHQIEYLPDFPIDTVTPRW
jgi:hypothetical protein